MYFLLWVIFNGNLTLEIACFGVAVAAALFLFTCKFTDYSIEREKWLLRNLPRLLRYVVVLVVEIARANFSVVHMILTEKEEIEPCLVSFKANLHTPFGRAALANAITLTPGTITVLLESDVYSVHCLDASLAIGMGNSVFVDMIRGLEQTGVRKTGEDGKESGNVRKTGEDRKESRSVRDSRKDSRDYRDSQSAGDIQHGKGNQGGN